MDGRLDKQMDRQIDEMTWIDDMTINDSDDDSYDDDDKSCCPLTYLMQDGSGLVRHLVELVDAADTIIRQHQCP